MSREIAEAYEVLRDPERRRQYESMGHDSFHANTGFRPGSTDFKDLFKDFEDLFKEFGPMENFFKQHFAAHKIQTEAHGGIFNFATDIQFGNLFDGVAQENMHDHMQNHGEELLKQAKTSEDGSGKKCRTVTKRNGNSVSTYTQCTSSSSTGNGPKIAAAEGFQHLGGEFWEQSVVKRQDTDSLRLVRDSEFWEESVVKGQDSLRLVRDSSKML